MLEKIIEFFENKKIAILGLGKEGISTYKFIRKYLANQFITLLDQKDISDNALFKNDNNLEIIYGDKYLENLNNYDIILKSPGVVLNNINDEVKNKIYSEIEILLKYKRENVIGITGTKGKSTTSSLLYKVLKNNKKDVFILGNIGNAIFDDLDKIKNDSLLVVEMSSHQLEYVNYSPHIGIILNLFQDHLDHAGSVELYHKSKLNIFKYQNKEDYAIYELDNKYLNDYLKDPVYKAKKYCFQEEENNKLNTMYIKENNIWLNKEKIYNLNQQRKLLGMHNLKNIMAVLIVAKILNLDMNITIDTIRYDK